MCYLHTKNTRKQASLRMPATKKSDITEKKAPFSFPDLSSPPRMVTRHFVNLHYCLSQDLLSLLSFLIFMSDQSNNIEYSVKLMNQYREAVKLAQDRYGSNKVKTSLPATRKLFFELIEKGLLIPINEAFIINPNLTYSKQISVSSWKKNKDSAENWVKLNVK